MFRKGFLLASVLSMMLFASLTSADYEPRENLSSDLQYNPEIHVYQPGVELEIMNDNVRYGSLISLLTDEEIRTLSEADRDSLEEIIVPIFEPGYMPAAVEQGPYFVPRAWVWDSGHVRSPNNVRWNTPCGGGVYADFYWIPEWEVWNVANRVYSHNVVTWAHIVWHNGLDGGYYCVGGQCTISLCTKDTAGANPWSVRLIRYGG
jgi:hypothetical protein